MFLYLLWSISSTRIETPGRHVTGWLKLFWPFSFMLCSFVQYWRPPESRNKWVLYNLPSRLLLPAVKLQGKQFLVLILPGVQSFIRKQFQWFQSQVSICRPLSLGALSILWHKRSGDVLMTRPASCDSSWAGESLEEWREAGQEFQILSSTL